MVRINEESEGTAGGLVVTALKQVEIPVLIKVHPGEAGIGNARNTDGHLLELLAGGLDTQGAQPEARLKRAREQSAQAEEEAFFRRR